MGAAGGQPAVTPDAGALQPGTVVRVRTGEAIPDKSRALVDARWGDSVRFVVEARAHRGPRVVTVAVREIAALDKVTANRPFVTVPLAITLTALA